MTLIEKLSTGNIALHNTGTFEELQRVLNAAFPDDHYINWESSRRFEHVYFYSQGACSNGQGVWGSGNNTHLSTYSTSEFIEELNNQTTNVKTNMKTISHQQAQSIIDIACDIWKQRLAEKWAITIALKKSINIPDNDYQGMRESCTDVQHKLFDKIFGKDTPEYKVGDWVTLLQNYFPDRTKTKQIVEINSEGWLGFDKIYRDYSLGLNHYNPSSYFVRLASPEEIKAATVIPKGTPCFVRDSIGCSWRLYYADGNGRFYPYGSKSESKHGSTDYKYYHKCSDGLPEE